MSKTPSIYQQFHPQNEQLKRFIKVYYVHQSNQPDTTEKITYFPNYNTTINIYKNNSVTWSNLSRQHEHDPSVNYLKLLVSKIDKSREMIMSGCFNKLTIVFHPLGINHFLDVPLCEISKEHFSFFDYFGASFDLLLNEVFTETDIHKKGSLLDKYFQQQYKGFPEERISNAVKHFLKTGGDISIQEIASSLNISRKTLLRLFKKHLNFTPTEYKSIIKFRNALNLYQSKLKDSNFSSLAYEAAYYDQSDLNFYFKEKTGLTPKQLFNIIDTIAKELFWKIDYVPKVQESK